MHLYYSTFPSKDAAVEIGQSLVTKKHIACMNVLGEGSAIYEWKGEAKLDTECFAIIKSSHSFDILWAFLKEIHPYETPCLIELNIENVNSDFAKWVDGV